MMNPIERYDKMKRLTKKANKIIAEKGLKFDDFFNTTNLYDYNCYIANSPDYKKLSVNEYETLRIIVKQEYQRLELI